MFANLLAAIVAIPKLLAAIQELLAWFKKAEEDKWFEQSNKVFDDLKKAEKPEELKKSAHDIQDLISKL